MIMAECIVFTGGGTGGHVFPALAVAAELRRRWPGRIVWIGSRGGIERSILEQKNIPFYGIPTGKLRRYLSLGNLLDAFKICAGFIAAVFILMRERPRLVFSKGGYVSVPPAAAAFLLGIPVFTHESDLNPGLATRINSRFAERILTSFPETLGYFRGRARAKVVHTGNPIRPEILGGEPARGKRRLGCPQAAPLVLVLGGSLGSAFLNGLIQEVIGELTAACFLVHQMGPQNYSARRRDNYYPAPFFSEELPDILAASDLVICRAGANTLWELAAVGKPALLVPLSQSASRGDQIENAAYFAQRGAARVLPEREATGARLLEIVANLLNNKSELRRMGERARGLALPEAAARIAEILCQRSGRAVGGIAI